MNTRIGILPQLEKGKPIKHQRTFFAKNQCFRVDKNDKDYDCSPKHLVLFVIAFYHYSIPLAQT